MLRAWDGDRVNPVLMQELTLGLEELRLLAAIGNVRVGAEPSGPTAPVPGEGKSMRGRAAPT